MKTSNRVKNTSNGMKTNKEKIKKLLSHNIEQVIKKESLAKKLLSGKKIRVKHGIDPTGPKIHLGRAIVLWKLKEFQDLGHKIILILGDYTAQIGDPSDKLHKRPFLSKKQIDINLSKYKKQIGQILNLKKIEWHKNSEWLGKLKPRKLDELADLFSVQQMMARRNFKERWDNQEEISIRELHYPLYQGYDSVMIKADLEIGGNDQLFNLLAGRKIQEAYGQKPQDIMTFKMLDGLDGDKMSTSKGNVINIRDSSQEQYGKIMSMKDELILSYFELCTLLTEKETQEIEKQMKQGVNPRNLKAKLAFEIVSLYHGGKEANKAALEFDKVFKEKKLPENIREIIPQKKQYNLLEEFLEESGLSSSKSEGRRLIKQRSAEIDGHKVIDWRSKFEPKSGMVIKIGKRRFIKIKKIK